LSFPGVILILGSVFAPRFLLPFYLCVKPGPCSIFMKLR
jgi:hypothetical protein